jgi:hypothetical protein
MKNKCLLFLLVVLQSSYTTMAQSSKTDSVQVAATLHVLLRICRSVDFVSPNVTKQGTFYKAAPYIV